MKVYKSVGAVDVYSPARVATIVAGAAALLAGAGFVGGLAAGGDSGSSSSSGSASAAVAPRPAPAASRPATPAPKSVDPRSPATTSTTGGARAAYRQGFSNGIAAVVGDAGALHAGDSYLVRLRPGKGGAPFSIGPRVTVETGKTYSLCSHGQRICMKQGGLAGAP